MRCAAWISSSPRQVQDQSRVSKRFTPSTTNCAHGCHRDSALTLRVGGTFTGLYGRRGQVGISPPLLVRLSSMADLPFLTASRCQRHLAHRAAIRPYLEAERARI